MAGIVGNYIFAYGFITDIANSRYFKESTIESDMETVKIKRMWRPFLNEVGWYHAVFGVGKDEQSKLYVFGERIRSVEDGTLVYMDFGNSNAVEPFVYDIEEDIFGAGLGYREIIDHEAARNGTGATFLLFMNDNDWAGLEFYSGVRA